MNKREGKHWKLHISLILKIVKIQKCQETIKLVSTLKDL